MRKEQHRDKSYRQISKGVLQLRSSRDFRKVIWPDDRDSIFLQWLAEDSALLQDAGFSPSEIKRMLATLKYVRFWSANPPWLFPIKKLPKGYRWRDGQKFSCKSGRRYDGYCYIFLPIGEDLYVKGMVVVGTKANDCPGAKIKRYKELTCTEVSHRLSTSPGLDSAIRTFWHSQGLEGDMLCLSSAHPSRAMPKPSLIHLTTHKEGETS